MQGLPHGYYEVRERGQNDDGTHIWFVARHDYGAVDLTVTQPTGICGSAVPGVSKIEKLEPTVVVVPVIVNGGW